MLAYRETTGKGMEPPRVVLNVLPYGTATQRTLSGRSLSRRQPNAGSPAVARIPP